MAVLTVAGVAAAANAQTSILYLTGDFRSDFRIMAYQGGVQLWDRPQVQWDDAPIAVVGNSIRTLGQELGTPGGRYDLSGRYIGPAYINNVGAAFFDSTSDGSSNYLVGYHSGNVYSTDTTYQNGTLLFTHSSNGHMGITYDPATNSLWFAGRWDGVVTNYDLDGNERFSFNTGLNDQRALALDHVDGTLWLVGDGRARQFDKAGNQLSSFQAVGLTISSGGGEFKIPVCRPDLNDDGSIDTADFLLFLNAWAAGLYLADWNYDGQVDTLDFLAYLNAWVASC